MKPQIKQEKAARVEEIIAAGLELAAKFGYTNITREAVSAKLGYESASLVSYHVGTMPNFLRTLMREAVRREVLPVIAQGLALKDRHALKASEELQKRAKATL